MSRKTFKYNVVRGTGSFQYTNATTIQYPDYISSIYSTLIVLSVKKSQIFSVSIAMPILSIEFNSAIRNKLGITTCLIDNIFVSSYFLDQLYSLSKYEIFVNATSLIGSANFIMYFFLYNYYFLIHVCVFFLKNYSYNTLIYKYYLINYTY